MPLFLLQFILLLLISTCSAKFGHTYHGTATDGVQACLANSAFTMSTLNSPSNCRAAFKCVMENIPNQGQAILSSGASILGFIPTVLLVLGTTNAEIVRIHARYPLLAFLLSITVINKRPDGAQNILPSQLAARVSLGPYGIVKQRESPALRSRATSIGIWVVHILAAIGATIVVWQTIEIGRNGVVSWACLTNFYPPLWIVGAVFHHLLSIGFMRVSLRTRRLHPTLPSSTKAKPAKPEQQTVKSDLVLLPWDLTQKTLQVEVRRKKFAKWSKVGADFVNNVNYLYGTAVFTSLTLVSGRVAIQKLAAFGLMAAAARTAAMWVLEDIEGEE